MYHYKVILFRYCRLLAKRDLISHMSFFLPFLFSSLTPPSLPTFCYVTFPPSYLIISPLPLLLITLTLPRLLLSLNSPCPSYFLSPHSSPNFSRPSPLPLSLTTPFPLLHSYFTPFHSSTLSHLSLPLSLISP